MDDHACLCWCRCALRIRYCSSGCCGWISSKHIRVHWRTIVRCFDVPRNRTRVRLLHMVHCVPNHRSTRRCSWSWCSQPSRRQGMVFLQHGRIRLESSSTTTANRPLCLGCSSLGHHLAFRSRKRRRPATTWWPRWRRSKRLRWLLFCPSYGNCRHHCFWNGRRALVHSSHDADLPMDSLPNRILVGSRILDQ